MRLLIAVVVLCAATSSAYAQSAEMPATRAEMEGECHAVSPTGQVHVTTSAGDTVRGTLMCLSDSRVWLLRNGRMSRIELDRVQRIRTPADPVWDGALTGALPPLLIWALLCQGDCPAEPFLRMSLTFGMVGLAGDAINTNRQTLYRAERRTLGFRWSLKF